MATNSQDPIATDSASELHKILGHDSTSTFEDDATFVDSNPTAAGSSENLGAAAADTEEEDELDADGNVVDDDDEEDDDVVVDDDGNESVDDDDEEFEDDDEDDEDDEDDDADEDEVEDGDVDETDDAAEVGSSPALRVDGLLGYEDEADDVAKGETVQQGNAERAKAEAHLDDGEDDDVADDGRENAVDEDKLNADEEVDLDGDESTLGTDDAAALRNRLSTLPTRGSAGDSCHA